MEGNGLGDTELDNIDNSDIGCHQQRLQNSLVTHENCVLGQWKQHGAHRGTEWGVKKLGKCHARSSFHSHGPASESCSLATKFSLGATGLTSGLRMQELTYIGELQAFKRHLTSTGHVYHYRLLLCGTGLLSPFSNCLCILTESSEKQKI